MQHTVQWTMYTADILGRQSDLVIDFKQHCRQSVNYYNGSPSNMIVNVFHSLTTSIQWKQSNYRLQ